MLRQFVRYFAEERLSPWVSPSQGEEPDRASWERDLGPDKAMPPVSVNREYVAEERDRPLGVRAAEVEQLAARGQRGVELPRPRDRGPNRGLCRSGAPPLSGRRDVGRGPDLEGAERAVVEAVPHLGLPPAVEVLQGSLEARILHRREHGDAAELQAEPHDPADDVREVVGALETQIVVELRERRNPEGAPARLQRGEHAGRRHAGGGPGVRQASVERKAGEHLDRGAALQHEPFDDVEAITVGHAPRDGGQVPAARGGRDGGCGAGRRGRRGARGSARWCGRPGVGPMWPRATPGGWRRRRTPRARSSRGGHGGASGCAPPPQVAFGRPCERPAAGPPSRRGPGVASPRERPTAARSGD